MRRFITTLAIFLVVVVAGMTSLVLLVNPNEFRDYMVQQVEQRSGYHLALNGNLRWHVWPQLSILSGQMTLTAPGAQQPIVSASNMRLDIKLLPLLSHQLAVKQVMLKGAVVRLTPESDSQRPVDAPVEPSNTSPAEICQDWRFDIGQLRVDDSLLIWQQSNGEQINVRDFNLRLSQNPQRLANIELTSRINRDQRELLLNLSAEMNLSQSPDLITATVNQLNYQLTGADLPKEGLQGQAKMQATWLADKQSFKLQNIALNANDSQLDGTVSGTLGRRPQIAVTLHSPLLNMDSLLGLKSSAGSNVQGLEAQRAGPAPVISQTEGEGNGNTLLNALDGMLNLNVDKMRWRGMDLDRVTLNASSKNGLVQLATLNGNIGSGSFSLPGTVDMRNPQTKVALRPVLQKMAVEPLLKAFDLPPSVTGDISLTGDFNGNGLSVPAFRRAWKGTTEVTLDNAQMNGLNFQQMIQRAVERGSNRVRGPDSIEASSNLQHITASVALNNGLLAFGDMQGQTSMLNYSGKGSVNISTQQADLTFGITMTQGWQGDMELVSRLQQTPIPLRIYGPWSALNYSLLIDQVLRQQLLDEAKKRLKAWSDRNQPAG
ncbi:outer membrane assembly protein AsmA [Erwinia tracheiphila]|uniref:Membrane assembly protein AsmA n=1 Tax=Erwinia tracheiphila TaxID=65700 RepID=A0A0M2KKB4_9GAMM|nr:outer membrane assembly protein AsmA [Erwinia tracheiphila]AXF76387.1 outer membrane assembly protein AsmA [Erwinia tracheiphila]KKF37762.1 membrane assembly protein AsmA [Erwinia tracheiphila]UIA84955.1 outer membrane assembly protein AsmA [Erwinia tracheiphila]UIA86783.1 outer membrane assembly protein AsmA [Erwinia tracheiphila]UIA93552.1 outer membrane assembly protein AsmA [Erwinia tracheiphila]